MSSSSSSYSN